MARRIGIGGTGAETEEREETRETGIEAAEEDSRICTASVRGMTSKISDLNRRGSCLVGLVLGVTRIALEEEEGMIEIEIGGIELIGDGIHEIGEEVEEGTTGEGEAVGMVG